MKYDIEKEDVFSRDEFSLYAVWSLDLSEDAMEADIVTVAAVIGVPGHLTETARVAGSGKGMATAWYNDSSDWAGRTREEAEAALDALIENAQELYVEHVEGGQ